MGTSKQTPWSLHTLSPHSMATTLSRCAFKVIWQVSMISRSSSKPSFQSIIFMSAHQPVDLCALVLVPMLASSTKSRIRQWTRNQRHLANWDSPRGPISDKELDDESNAAAKLGLTVWH